MIKVSEGTSVTACTGTVQSQWGRIQNVKQMGFETGPEDSHGRCGGDVFG